LIWRFTLVLIKINNGQIGDQTGLINTTNPVFYTSGNIFFRRTGVTYSFFHWLIFQKVLHIEKNRGDLPSPASKALQKSP
jgi:hypothetical protein